MIEVVCRDEQGIIWNVPSHSSNETYVCAIDEENEVWCSCYDFLYRKACKHPHLGDVECYCKHLKEVLDEK